MIQGLDHVAGENTSHLALPVVDDLVSMLVSDGEWQMGKEAYNVIDTGVGTADQGDETNNQDEGVQGTEGQVFRLTPLTLADEEEPHQRREVEGEA